MAVIRSFAIHGLAGRPGVVARDLNPSVNVLWGLNGSGKTSLLKILHAALRNDTAPLHGTSFAKAEVVFWSQYYDTEIRRTISGEVLSDSGPGYARHLDMDIDDLDEPGVRLEPVGDGLWREVEVKSSDDGWFSELVSESDADRLSQSLTPSGRHPIDLPYLHSYLPVSRLSLQLGRGSWLRRETPRPAVRDSTIEDEFAQGIESSWKDYNARANGKIRSVQQQGLAEILSILFGGSSGPAPESPNPLPDEADVIVREFLAEQNIHLHLTPEGFKERYENRSDLHAVVAAIEDVRRDVQRTLRPQEQLRRIVETLYSGNKRLMLDTLGPGRLRVEADSRKIPLRSLSSGEKQLLRLLLEVLGAERMTVMIDEPELSMHVDWQEQLLAAMQSINPDCQLIVATHSPEVMVNVPDECIFQL